MDRVLRTVRKLVDRTWRRYINLPAARQSRYRSGDIGRVAEYAACNRTSPTRSGGRLRRKGLPLPDGDTVLRRLGRRDWEELALDFQRAIGEQVRWARRHGLLRGPMDAAADFEYVEYYGKRRWFTIGGKPKNGTTKFLGFAVLSVLFQGEKFVVASAPVFRFSEPEIVLLGLLDRSPVPIRRLLLDRWFYNSHVYQALTEFDIGYLGCARRTSRLERARKRAQRQGLNHAPITMGGELPHETTLLFTKKKGRWRYFVTNLNVPSNERAEKLMEFYRKRWNVENSIRDKNPFMARTASRNYSVRYAFYMLSLLYYNFWILGNILLAVSRRLRPGAPLWSWFDFRADLLEVAFPGIR